MLKELAVRTTSMRQVSYAGVTFKKVTGINLLYDKYKAKPVKKIA